MYKRLYMIALGTRLRLLIEHLDHAVDGAYREAGLDFRARYYPYYRTLLDREDCSVGEFAASLGFSQPAVTQTLTLMKNEGLIEPAHADDARQRRYRLSAKGASMNPRLQILWAAIDEAAARLDRSLPAPLQATVAAANDALSEIPFTKRIAEVLERA
jgi:MarR family transcriptional regulator, organic hydroperoxide resistance regulator